MGEKWGRNEEKWVEIGGEMCDVASMTDLCIILVQSSDDYLMGNGVEMGRNV